MPSYEFRLKRVPISPVTVRRFGSITEYAAGLDLGKLYLGHLRVIALTPTVDV